jgi:glucan 1,3-beta-glucosidase
MISTPIIMYYYTELVGDALNLPMIKALPSFFGIGLLDSDVYYPGGASCMFRTCEDLIRC